MKNHYNYSIDAVYNGIEAIEYAKNGAYDVIVLDVMMPLLDGISALKEIRKLNITTPVLMLTAKTEIEDKILGLDCGADDYLPKTSEEYTRIKKQIDATASRIWEEVCRNA